MGLAIDWFNEIVQVTSPTVNVDGQTLADFIEDQMATPVGLQHSDIIKPEGKIEDPSNPGIFSQIIIILNSPWQVQFFAGSGYTRIFGAKLVGGLADEPMKATGTAGDITVLESPVDGVTVAVGSGLDAGQDQKLTDIDAQLATIEGTLDHQEAMRLILAAAAGILSGAGPAATNIKMRDQADTKDRIDATVDADGNRTAVVVDATP